MTRLRCVHLCDDFALGGVAKGLSVYAHPDLAAQIDSQVLPADPRQRLAPRLATDIIFTHFPPSWQALPFLASLRLRNPAARLIHIEHSYTGAWEAAKVANPRRFRTMLRLACRLFDEVVAVSHGQARWLRAATGLKADKLQVLHPWSGSQQLDRVALPTIAPERPLVLGAFGRFSEQKGFDTLIDAMAQLDPARFSLLLGGFGADDAALRAQAAGLPHVHFVGKVGDVPEFLSRCDVIVVPSRWEAFGQVVAEAKLAGRAVLVADVDGMPEQVGDAGVIADCSTAETLAAAMAALPAQPLAAMGIAGRQIMLTAERERIAAWQALFARHQPVAAA
ncbi:glycosyltransferase [Sandarakinorhabdus sp.]|uniref:glycosyltransferase n=1 Tax=Sandarakinorhabdus sp. TaxID=1916663 RepID=UPI003340B025